MLAQARYSLALNENIQQMLADFTAAYNANVVTDSEAFTSTAGASMPVMNLAQAARNMQALNVPNTSSLTPLPLDSNVQPIVSDWLKFGSLFASPAPSSSTYQPSDEFLFWAVIPRCPGRANPPGRTRQDSSNWCCGP
jgi:hypothetical protein